MIDAGEVSWAAICLNFEQIWCSTRSKSSCWHPWPATFAVWRAT